MDKNRNHIWSFPLVGGVLTLIGLFTPGYIVSGNFTWLFGLLYMNSDPLFHFFYWNPLLFLFNLIPFILLLSLSITVIILSLISRNEGDFLRFKKFFLVLGALFFIPTLYHFIWAAISFGPYVYLFILGFAFIAPMISGAIIILGTIFNTHCLIRRSQRPDLIIKVKKCYRNILISLSIGGIIFLVGSVISFNLIYFLPGDPVFAYLAAMGIFSPTPAQFAAARAALGFDLPIFLQYIKFLCQTSIGDLGISVSLAVGTPVFDFLFLRVPRMIEVMALPLIIVVGLGILLGRFLAKKRGRWYDKLIQLIMILGLSLPVFFICMALQFSLGFTFGIIPTWGFKNPVSLNPTLRTGFLIFDSILDMNFALAMDIFYHLLTPMIILGIMTFVLITWQTRSYIINKSYNKSILRHTVITASIFGFLFMFYLLIDIAFSLAGFGSLLIDSIYNNDYFLLSRSTFTLVIILAIVVFISAICFSLYKYLKSVRIKPKSESNLDDRINKEEVRNDKNSEENFKEFLIRKIKNPLGIASIMLLIFFIIISIFPQLITQYTLQEALSTYVNPWAPPSPDHPLGQTALGGDVLALVMYGIQESMLFGFLAILIGLAGGIPLGYLAGRFRKWGYKAIMGIMVFFYILPMLLIVILISRLIILISGISYLFILLSTGILLIPFFTQAIANVISGNIRSDLRRIAKMLVSHIPLNFAIAVTIYTAVGYLGFSHPPIGQQLGNLINDAHSMLYSAPWASFWPGLAIFGIVFTFFLFYLAFQNLGQPSRVFKVKFRKTEKTSEPLEIRME
ncbi:MAG: hypothetical protein ACFE9C_09730 [Candidatus Hodarchaeota archaeon]